LIAKSHRWQKNTLALATALAMELCASQAQALSLGRISVLSPLGSPLLAEVEILDINAEEAASLKTKAASPEAFKAAGLEYNPALTSLTITLEKRPDDRSYLRIRGDRTINDPFVDLMLEASWGSGRIVRDYTLLFDPPNSRPNQVSILSTPQLSSVPAQINAPAPIPRSNETRSNATNSTRPPALPRTVVKKPAPPAEKPAVSDQSVTVKPGDTAGRIAATLINPSISLDQMLVAMLRANPEAFVAGNVNRIRAGAVLNIPGAEDVLATPAPQAKQIILTQSQDFNEFRNKLATLAPVTPLAVANRQSGGAIQSKVEDKKPSASVPDKLTLAQGIVNSNSSEAAIAKERQTKEVAKKADDASKNIADLNKLLAATAPSVAGPVPPVSVTTTPAKAASTPTLTASPVMVAPVIAPMPAPLSSAPITTANTPDTEASAPQLIASASVKNAVATVPAPMPAPESSLIDELLDDPLVPAAAGGLIFLLAGLGFYRHKKRKVAAQMDSEFTESRIQPDSFFGASGGQQVDTQDSALAGSSMLYTPSQLESADDVDPVAEADVYLAYGRDIQAEEILKEALRMHPGRIAIHQKLLEIYAKRRDLKSFENISKQALTVSGGEGQEWGRVSELGRSIDPSNELYQSIVQMTSTPEHFMPTPTHDLDLDLDFSLDDAPPDTPQVEVESFDSNTKTAHRDFTPPPSDMDFEFNLSETPVAPSYDHAPSSSHASIQSHAFDATEVNELTYPTSASQDIMPVSHDSLPTAPIPLAQAPTNEVKAEDSGLLEFDLGSLSLDLGPTTEQTPDEGDDPLGTKLALATEFGSIGDLDGARNLIEEVIAEASGEMKAKAQQALSQLR
jgi:pilus assembly protein FimV